MGHYWWSKLCCWLTSMIVDVLWQKYICPKDEEKHNWNLIFNRIPIWNVTPLMWSALQSWRNIFQHVTIEMLHNNVIPAALLSYIMLEYLHFSPELAFLSSPCNSFIQLYACWKVSQCSSGKNLIMENNLMLVNNVKQAALNCPGPAGFIIPSKFNYLLRKQLGRSLLSVLSNSII